MGLLGPVGVHIELVRVCMSACVCVLRLLDWVGARVSQAAGSF